MTPTDRYPHVVQRPGPQGREAFVLGTGLTVWELAKVRRDLGGDASAVAHHLGLDEALVAEGLAYADAHHMEMALALARLDATGLDELRAILPGLRAFEIGESPTGTQPAGTGEQADAGTRRDPGIADAIRRLARLREDWDSYGAAPVSEPALDTAVLLLRASDSEGLPAPHHLPTRAGGVQLEWRSAERELELEVSPDGMVSYLRAERETVREGDVPRYDERYLRAHLRWLRHGGNAASSQDARGMDERDVPPDLDPGIADAVRRLSDAGITTHESCQGGAGHMIGTEHLPEPYITFTGDWHDGFAALALFLRDPHYRVAELRRVWRVIDGEPEGPTWKLVFFPLNQGD